MYGRNPVANVRPAPSGISVNSIFYTIQGEGPHAGRPALFVRLAKCNLRCMFCDTEFDKGTDYSVSELAEVLIRRAITQHNCNFVVVTGGEPMLQDALPFLIEQIPMEVQIETAGTVAPKDFARLLPLFAERLSIVCSPKTPKICDEVARHACAFKYIIRYGEVDMLDGLPNMSTQISNQAAHIYRASRDIWVQPCDDGDPVANDHNIRATVQSAMRYGYRLSMQLHKIVDVQ